MQNPTPPCDKNTSFDKLDAFIAKITTTSYNPTLYKSHEDSAVATSHASLHGLTRRMQRTTISSSQDINNIFLEEKLGLTKNPQLLRQLPSSLLLKCYRAIRISFFKIQKAKHKNLAVIQNLLAEVQMILNLHRHTSEKYRASLLSPNTSSNTIATASAKIKAKILLRLNNIDKKLSDLLNITMLPLSADCAIWLAMKDAHAKMALALFSRGEVGEAYRPSDDQLRHWREYVNTMTDDYVHATRIRRLHGKILRFLRLMQNTPLAIDTMIELTQGKLKYVKRFTSYFHHPDYQSIKRILHYQGSIQTMLKCLSSVRQRYSTSLSHEQSILLSTLSDEAEEYYETLRLHKQVIKHCLSPGFAPIYKPLRKLRQDLENMKGHKSSTIKGITGIDPADILILQRRLYALDPSCTFKKSLYGAEVPLSTKINDALSTLLPPSMLIEQNSSQNASSSYDVAFVPAINPGQSQLAAELPAESHKMLCASQSVKQEPHVPPDAVKEPYQIASHDLPDLLPNIPQAQPQKPSGPHLYYQHAQHRISFQSKTTWPSKNEEGPILPEKADPLVQSLLYELLYDCYDHLYQLSSQLEPVSSELIPLHTKLLSLKRILMELWKLHLCPAQVIKIDRTAPNSHKTKRLQHVDDIKMDLEKALIPLKMQLSAIDEVRVDGKFKGSDGKRIPKGQAALHSLLGECYDLLDQLSDFVETFVPEDSDYLEHKTASQLSPRFNQTSGFHLQDPPLSHLQFHKSNNIENPILEHSERRFLTASEAGAEREAEFYHSAPAMTPPQDADYSSTSDFDLSQLEGYNNYELPIVPFRTEE
jgi:Protein of unknown function (DUF2408)